MAWAAVAASALAACAGEAAAATPPETLADAVTGGHLILEMRGRYEGVDQDKTGVIAKSAEALTLRTRLGWETAPLHGLSGLVELENVQHLGPERFAVNVPGASTPPLNGADKARYPLVNDPDVTELNRAQIAWKASPQATFTLGRQRILIDDQRFVGNVGWRQDEQTFDAARADLAFGKASLVYAYVTRANRILGDQRDWRSDSHLVNLAWAPDPRLRLEGFVYALDFENSPANTSITRGLKVSGKAPAGPLKLAYGATWARQSDWRRATAPYDLDYWAADLAATYDIVTAKAAYEWLEGNGVRGFTTPLATSHAFQGWADAWVQPLGGNKGFVDGLKDFNLTLDLKPKVAAPRLANPDLMVRYHAFDDERSGARLAHEWDALAQASLSPKLVGLVKYADFRREAHVPAGTATPPPSRTKLWVSLEYRY